MTRSIRSSHPIALARQSTRRRLDGEADAGFTLIELVVVVAILPIVVGGIAVALLSIIGLQTQTNSRIGDSNDELYSSTTFNKDVQSAEQIETNSTPACGGPAQTQLLGLQWALNSNGTYTTVVSYVTVPHSAANGTTTTTLLRQICTSGASTTPAQTRTISHDVGSPTLTFTPNNFVPIPTTAWMSTHGLFGVMLNITAPGSNYTYTLSGLPGAATSNGTLSQITQQPNPAGCNLASLGSGTYANVLCFADFSSFTDPSSAAGCQQMNLSIADSPDFLRFCVIATPQNTVRPQSIPTYYDPKVNNSEAYLGNNGFYTGIAGLPALSQRPQPNFCTNNCTFSGQNGATTAITFNNIQVTDAVGNPVGGWTLVTGDAESTDTNGWLEFQNSSVNWSILPNSPTSLWGNSCYSDANPNNQGVLQWTGPVPPTSAAVGIPTNGPPPAANATTLSIGAAPNYATSAKGILCEENVQLNKTGSLMVAAPEPANSSAAQNVTVTLQGEGYQAIFLGVLL